VRGVYSNIKLSWQATHDFWEIPVLYEDAHLLALDKPAGLLTSPDRCHSDRVSLMQLLHGDILRGSPWVAKHHLSYLANAHRLDSEASGVLLLAKSKPGLIELANQFGAEQPCLCYVALVHGSPDDNTFALEAKVGPHPLQPGVMRVDEKRGKKASTNFEVLERFNGFTLLKCQPLTARAHQVRVHLQYLHLPLVGDTTYGGRPLWLSRLKHHYRLKPNHVERALLERASLHAEHLTFVHPESRLSLTVSSPWPKDLRVAVKYLRQFAPSAATTMSDSPVDSPGSNDNLPPSLPVP
jgi:RluA family pseudouridine synthase